MKDIEKIIFILRKTNKISMLGSFSREKPFYVLISTILSARNKDTMTRIAVKKLFSKYKTPKQIANAPLTDLKKLIKQSGTYKTKAKRIKETSNILLKEYKGKVPDEIEELIKLPGVGRKTAGCVLVYAFGKPEIPVDVHVAKISRRLGWTKEKDPNKINEDLKQKIPKKFWKLINELFVIHGQNICFKRNPLCNKCSVTKYCDYYKNLYI